MVAKMPASSGVSGRAPRAAVIGPPSNASGNGSARSSNVMAGGRGRHPLDRRDDLVHAELLPTQAVHGRTGQPGTGRRDERLGRIVGELELVRAAEVDVIRAAGRGRDHRQRRLRRHALVAARAVDQVRSKADARDAGSLPEDPRALLVGHLEHAVVRGREEFRVRAEHGLTVVTLRSVHRGAARVDERPCRAAGRARTSRSCPGRSRARPRSDPPRRTGTEAPRDARCASRPGCAPRPRSWTGR